jgi:prepilin-type N-terminal cleavage/methylation domain-containing protein
MIFEKLENNKGFTLIELLVVIGIISIISSIVVGQVNDAKQKAINSSILQSIEEVQKALELYASDHNGVYPKVGANSYTKIGDSQTIFRSPSFDLPDELKPYIKEYFNSILKGQQIQYFV